MPKVPQYNVASVRNEPLPQVRFNATASPASFGANESQGMQDLAQGMGRLGYTLGNIAHEEQDSLNKSFVREAFSNAKNDIRDYLSNDIYQRSGKNAVNVLDEVKGQFGKIKEKYATGLQNDAQKQIYETMFRDIEDDHVSHVQNFQIKQRKAYEHATIAAENMNAINDAVMNQNDPEAIKKAEQTLGFNTAYQHKGMGGVVVHGEVSKALSMLHEKILESKANSGTAIDALKYLEENKSKFLPTDYFKYKGKLSEVAKNEAALNAAATLAGLPTMDDAIREADKTIVDPDTREKTIEATRTRMMARDKALSDQEKQKIEGVWKDIIDDPSRPTPKDIPHDEFLRLEKYKQERLKPQPIQTDMNVYGELLRKLGHGELSFEDIKNNAGRLAIVDYKNLLEEVTKPKHKDGERGFDTIAREAESEAQKLSIFHIKDDDDDATKKEKTDNLNQFMGEYRKRLLSLPKDRRDNWDESQKIRDGLLKDVVIKKRSFFPDKKAPEYKVSSGAVKVESPLSVPSSNESLKNDMVSVVSPDGKIGKIPRSRLGEALKAGYKEK